MALCRTIPAGSHVWYSRSGVLVVSCVPQQARTAWDRPLTHLFMSWKMWAKARVS